MKLEPHKLALSNANFSNKINVMKKKAGKVEIEKNRYPPVGERKKEWGGAEQIKSETEEQKCLIKLKYRVFYKTL